MFLSKLHGGKFIGVLKRVMQNTYSVKTMHRFENILYHNKLTIQFHFPGTFKVLLCAFMFACISSSHQNHY